MTTHSTCAFPYWNHLETSCCLRRQNYSWAFEVLRRIASSRFSNNCWCFWSREEIFRLPIEWIFYQHVKFSIYSNQLPHKDSFSRERLASRELLGKIRGKVNSLGSWAMGPSSSQRKHHRRRRRIGQDCWKTPRSSPKFHVLDHQQFQRCMMGWWCISHHHQIRWLFGTLSDTKDSWRSK